MNKEIAVFVNDFGVVANSSDYKVIKVFSKIKDKWEVTRELPFKLKVVNNEFDIKPQILLIIELLKNCRIFVANEFSNLEYTIIYNMGVSIWRMKGEPYEFLDYILEKEDEEAEEIKNINSNDKCFTPVKIGERNDYIFNIKELQEHNICISSKQALKPFLQSNNFNELIITCNHIPNWLEDELIELKLSYKYSKIMENDYILIINNNNKM